MKLLGLAFAACALLGACGASTSSPSSAVAPSFPAATDTESAAPTPDQAMMIENRGGPAFDVFINGRLASTVACDGFDRIEASTWPLPWDLSVVRSDISSPVLSENVTKLPAWLMQFGAKLPKFSYTPMIGPVFDCPSPGALAASPHPTGTLEPSLKSSMTP
jgi:hypothetical protein